MEINNLVPKKKEILLFMLTCFILVLPSAILERTNPFPDGYYAKTYDFKKATKILKIKEAKEKDIYVPEDQKGICASNHAYIAFWICPLFCVLICWFTGRAFADYVIKEDFKKD